MNRLLPLALCLGLAGAAVADDDAKKDKDAMQGDWACEQFVRDGLAFPDDDAHALFRTVKGDTFTIFRFRKKSGSGTFKVIDATKSPRQIDLIPDDGPSKGKPSPGIYKLEGDTMTICIAPPGQKRPTEFVSKPGTGYNLAVWKREKK